MPTATSRAASLATAATAALLSLTLVGCSTGETGPSSSAAPTSTGGATSLPTAASPSAAPSTTTKVTNDLATGKRTQVIKSETTQLTVTYATPVRKWTTNGEKQISVSATARSLKSGDPKIYLARTSLNMALFDASGSLDAPDALVDGASGNPYLVNFPNTYSNDFFVPAVNVGATELQMTFIFVILSEVPTAKSSGQDAPVSSSRDYTKQTATDVVTIPLSS